MNNTLSVVITAYDEHELTCRHVQACMDSTRPPDEIIVINDHGTTDLREKLLQLKLSCKVIYAYIEDDIKWNYTGGRNLGFWLSTGTLLSMEDNDHMMVPTYYEKALAEFEDLEIKRVTVGKRWVVTKKDMLTKPMADWEIISTRPPHEDTAILRREIFWQTKGFDERFAGEYGWSSTAWRRRLGRIDAFDKTKRVDNAYVVHEEKSRKEIPGKMLSYRNHKYAREDYIQPEHGVLNFKYFYEELRN